MSNINEIMTIQFRVPKKYISEFDKFINDKGFGVTPNSFVKDMVVTWMDRKFGGTTNDK